MIKPAGILYTVDLWIPCRSLEIRSPCDRAFGAMSTNGDTQRWDRFNIILLRLRWVCETQHCGPICFKKRVSTRRSIVRSGWCVRTFFFDSHLVRGSMRSKITNFLKSKPHRLCRGLIARSFRGLRRRSTHHIQRITAQGLGLTTASVVKEVEAAWAEHPEMSDVTIR